MKIKNILVGLIFISLGVYAFSLESCVNIKLACNGLPSDTTISELQRDPVYNKSYRLKGAFDFSSCFEVKEIRDSDTGHTENITGYMYRFNDGSTDSDLLIRNILEPELMCSSYSNTQEIVITLRDIDSREMMNFLAAEAGTPFRKLKAKNGTNTAKNKKDLFDTLKRETERGYIYGFHGEMFSDNDDITSHARWKLVRDFFFGGFLIFLGTIVLIETVKGEDE